ncbi:MULTISPECIES: inorganic phosphate transporter [Pasteurellaceae]|uniref:Phosphate transporter n=1 Tax=Pasteurella atlantica TaxID=2827233 RepID=A0AAW8CN39_9PAST|nr:inorganic phosphate transporter [Pasteurella atlantica]MBR0573634.1 inorganic phosphate transporter [Pasteurella atlantica]MDP8039389.1 inorganic phosphate transporter [Pasteurella atlantica]MDP8041481.1 inorganic phosphate transporter [Pasteurella atlantica]MDP8043594.1 inorganic phosphate transporter [Pasteurella atlantica]MDP8045702.1 inorganic phosphate transporter [Pasteurella atlantica]
MELIQQYGHILIIITAIFGFFMAFGIGANDVSNAMGTSVGSGVLTIKQTIIIAIVFEFAGAYLAGGEVTQTIKGGIIDVSLYADMPDVLVLGMMASLFASGTWLLIASRMGWPVSTTHSIIGAIIGFGCVTAGTESVEWSKILGIVGSWFVTPFVAGVFAYLVFSSTQRLIFDTSKPVENAKKYGPYYMGLTAFVLCVVTMKKGLKHIGLHLEWSDVFIVSLIIAIISTVACHFYFKKSAFDKIEGDSFESVEKVFGILMVITACAMAFAHGSNDVANAIGPLSAVASIVETGGQVAGKTALAPWILPLGGAGIVVGLVVLGYKVMGTIGTGITELTPSRGFAAQFSCATTVVIASGTGLPISTTQTLVGAILGVGFARGIAALNLNVIRNIVASWVITLPAGAFISIIIYHILNTIFR